MLCRRVDKINPVTPSGKFHSIMMLAYKKIIPAFRRYQYYIFIRKRKPVQLENLFSG
jgi:hypothetical protein